MKIYLPSFFTIPAAVVLAMTAPPALAVALASVEVVRLNFDVGTNGQPAPTIPNLGVEPDIQVDVVTQGGGVIVVAAGRPGNGHALDLPNHNGAASGSRGVVKVIDGDLGDGDALSPGLASFTFGADFTLDAVNASTPYDAGNVLIQRGLSGSSDIFKIEIEQTASGPQPSCTLAQRVDGTLTRTASVRSSVIIESTTGETLAWHRVRCTRQGSTLAIVVTPYNADGTAKTAVTTLKAGIPAIDLTWPTAAPVAPMAIGGKLTTAGAITSQSDQFNGRIDNTVFVVD